ncbi:hypothetical protein EW093_13945 [Thiospirochaeta perfilievii]|uniref:PilZN3 domain-containing protein n=1 Tax=Thiospirochaeta perfilievii TaxID=252967 RepID=A0A5C1QFD0_9SPIO|nr:PilZN3 domain-containing protein [Thiospirochaeta perfilievii]QEN05759.1 hypothetical protein EW093_13945 [Thiospirochaeta perfilievii]
MGLLTKQDIDNFYKNYQNEEVIFTKSIASLLGLQPKHIYFKFKDIQRPCIIYSSSMTKAKIIASVPKSIIEIIKTETNINLRFALKNEEKKNDSLFFFIKCRTIDITPYKPEQNLYIIHFEYISKPPEALITILGRLLEAKRIASERSEERIIVDKNNFSKLGLNSTAIKLIIDNIPRQAIIRDLSFHGMKFLLAGNAKFLNNKVIKVEFSNKDYGLITLLGKSIRADSMANRKDIVLLAVQFDDKYIPVQYNIILNEYLKSNKFMNKLKTDIEVKE